jgi:DNA mismatch repair ATPase MutS
MKYFWKIVGQVSVYTQLARDPSWIPVKWSDSIQTLSIEPFSDLAIQKEKAIKSSLVLKGHSLLTGPNRGGKSSNLRAILQQVLLGQTTGFTYLANGSWKPFSTIFTRLKSQDTAGKESLFEMEVRFASQIINTVKKQKKHVLVLIDEIFHSTNPPDAETSAKLFLEILWKYPHVKSIISTHIFSLCEGKHPIQTFYCDAEEDDDGKLKYFYKLTEGGVCKISSVREVLIESGLLCA